MCHPSRYFRDIRNSWPPTERRDVAVYRKDAGQCNAAVVIGGCAALSCPGTNEYTPPDLSENLKFPFRINIYCRTIHFKIFALIVGH